MGEKCIFNVFANLSENNPKGQHGLSTGGMIDNQGIINCFAPHLGVLLCLKKKAKQKNKTKNPTEMLTAPGTWVRCIEGNWEFLICYCLMAS